jgi:hypothetical protein
MKVANVPAASLLNISGWKAWLPRVTAAGPAYAERASRWVSLFEYHRQVQLVTNASAVLGPLAQANASRSTAVTAGRTLTEAYSKMMRLLLQFTASPGELGMLAVHEQINWLTFNRSLASLLNSAPGTGLSPDDIAALQPTRGYTGAPRIFQTTVRTAISRDEPGFTVEATVLAASSPATVLLHLDDVGSPAIPMQLQGGQVYATTVPVPAATAFSYYIEASFADKTKAPIRTPRAANQSVIVVNSGQMSQAP